MKLFNAGAMRRATPDARLTAANDLVQRTLAQHGLAAQSGPMGASELPAMPSINDFLSKLGAAPSSPAGPAADIPAGARFLNDTFTCPAGSRSFRTYVPASAAAGASGVVVMLHGCTQTPEDFAAGTGMNRLAEEHGFIVVYPAQSRRDNTQSCWNWFSRGDQRRDMGEPAILAGMVQQVCATHGIAKDRTFVAGLSAGAAMAVILGETYPDVFAAVGVHSGLAFGSAKDVASAFAAMAGPTAAPLQKKTHIPTIVFHGTADATVHLSNGDAVIKQAQDAGPGQTLETLENGSHGGRSYSVLRCASASGQSTLEHWTVSGLGHAWSGGQKEGSYTDPKGPDASAEMIRFFFEIPTQGA
ncbi:extracellular catalytic domain type 1 short-chain-length polyhydroxyalkanoate depolymerase [Sulfitobacter delicatus]|uniref:Esterase, PHB depolymerase family n=1 Tax=Sulfitobacter delicatus TaxID=218672 RepID=A0A1G7R291_9RHOB|nr:PHB depolymerase family esterase [Sulfitobacter delicatus]SDG04865.1 esterase, PHB depolymerase family [Sulfitobacter delicatus]